MDLISFYSSFWKIAVIPFVSLFALGIIWIPIASGIEHVVPRQSTLPRSFWTNAAVSKSFAFFLPWLYYISVRFNKPIPHAVVLAFYAVVYGWWAVINAVLCVTLVAVGFSGTYIITRWLPQIQRANFVDVVVLILVESMSVGFLAFCLWFSGKGMVRTWHCLQDYRPTAGDRNQDVAWEYIAPYVQMAIWSIVGATMCVVVPLILTLLGLAHSF